MSISKQTAASCLPSRVTPRVSKACWKVPEKETAVWELLPSVTWSQRILFSLPSLCLLTWKVGGIFHFAGFLGGFPQNLTTFTFLNSPPGAFLSAHSTPARCVVLSSDVCSCSFLHLFSGGLLASSHHSGSVQMTPPQVTWVPASLLSHTVYCCSHSFSFFIESLLLFFKV